MPFAQGIIAKSHRTAIIGIGFRFCLASVGRISVAFDEAALAGRDHTFAIFAFCRGNIRKFIAIVVTSPAMLDRVRNIDACRLSIDIALVFIARAGDDAVSVCAFFILRAGFSARPAVGVIFRDLFFAAV